METWWPRTNCWYTARRPIPPPRTARSMSIVYVCIYEQAYKFMTSGPRSVMCLEIHVCVLLCMREPNSIVKDPYLQIKEPGYCRKTMAWGPRAVACLEPPTRMLQCIREPNSTAKEPYVQVKEPGYCRQKSKLWHEARVPWCVLILLCACCYGVATISRLLKIIGLFAGYGLFYRSLLQKRPIIWRSLIGAATPCAWVRPILPLTSPTFKYKSPDIVAKNPKLRYEAHVPWCVLKLLRVCCNVLVSPIFPQKSPISKRALMLAQKSQNYDMKFACCGVSWTSCVHAATHWRNWWVPYYPKPQMSTIFQ